MTFPKASDRIDLVNLIASWLRQHKIPGATTKKAQKSAILRIPVPKLDILKGFDSVEKDELNQCFDAIKELAEFANIIGITYSIASGVTYDKKGD